jgi:hypothetical protein
MHSGRLSVAGFGPGIDFAAKMLGSGDAPIQTLSAEHTELNLSHVQLAAMLGRVMEFQLIQNAPGLGRGEGFI